MRPIQIGGRTSWLNTSSLKRLANNVSSLDPSSKIKRPWSLKRYWSSPFNSTYSIISNARKYMATDVWLSWYLLAISCGDHFFRRNRYKKSNKYGYWWNISLFISVINCSFSCCNCLPRIDNSTKSVSKWVAYESILSSPKDVLCSCLLMVERGIPIPAERSE